MVASSLGSAGGNFRASRHAARPRLSRTHHQPCDRARGGAGSLCQNKVSLRLTNPTLTGVFAAAIASRGETSAASNRFRFVTQFNIVMFDSEAQVADPVAFLGRLRHKSQYRAGRARALLARLSADLSDWLGWDVGASLGRECAFEARWHHARVAAPARDRGLGHGPPHF